MRAAPPSWLPPSRALTLRFLGGSSWTVPMRDKIPPAFGDTFLVVGAGGSTVFTSSTIREIFQFHRTKNYLPPIPFFFQYIVQRLQLIYTQVVNLFLKHQHILQFVQKVQIFPHTIAIVQQITSVTGP